MSYEGLNVILLHGNFAANGQAAAELAIPFMKSRRRIALPKAGTKPIRTRLQQGFATREMGSGWVKSRHWGRCDHVRSMSALPPKADIGTQSRNVRFVPKADILRRSNSLRYSIISLASASSVGGTVMSSALAVLRLMTSSYFVGCCTGSSAGFSPLRMRST